MSFITSKCVKKCRGEMIEKTFSWIKAIAGSFYELRQDSQGGGSSPAARGAESTDSDRKDCWDAEE